MPPELETNEINIVNFERIVKKYEPLMKSAVKAVHQQYHANHRIEKEDLESAALFGMYKAVKTYDGKKGVYFGVYAKVIIFNEVKSHARSQVPHYFEQDGDQKHPSGQPKFKRIFVHVGSLDYETPPPDSNY